MEPITIAAIALGGTGLGLQMKGAHEAGKQAEAQAKSQNEWNEYNAKIAEREALVKLDTAAAEERKHRKEGERIKARRRTQAGQAGILPELSFEDVQKETTTELEIDALNIRRSGQAGAQALTAEAQLSRMSGKSALLRGKATRRASRWGMLSSGLSGGSQLAYMAS